MAISDEAVDLHKKNNNKIVKRAR